MKNCRAILLVIKRLIYYYKYVFLLIYQEEIETLHKNLKRIHGIKIAPLKPTSKTQIYSSEKKIPMPT